MKRGKLRRRPSSKGSCECCGDCPARVHISARASAPGRRDARCRRRAFLRRANMAILSVLAVRDAPAEPPSRPWRSGRTRTAPGSATGRVAQRASTCPGSVTAHRHRSLRQKERTDRTPLAGSPCDSPGRVADDGQNPRERHAPMPAISWTSGGWAICRRTPRSFRPGDHARQGLTPQPLGVQDRGSHRCSCGRDVTAPGRGLCLADV